MPDESILLEAERTVNGPRQAIYGHPLDNFSRLGKLMSGILGIEVTAEQAALCMVAVKISRLIQTPDHRDSDLDGAGYFWVHRAIVEERVRRTMSPVTVKFSRNCPHCGQQTEGLSGPCTECGLEIPKVIQVHVPKGDPCFDTSCKREHVPVVL